MSINTRNETHMLLLKTITDKDICGTDELSNASPRIAVRAVLLDVAGQMALIYLGKFGFYTLPGGGVETGEDFELALKRELLEETGCNILVLHELGYIIENRAKNDFTQQSYYFLARVVGDKSQPVLTREETEEEHRVEWHPIETAYELVASPNYDNYQRKYLQERDKVVLQAAIDYIRAHDTLKTALDSPRLT
jgi:8-oxo-dGTP diphosphatase